MKLKNILFISMTMNILSMHMPSYAMQPISSQKQTPIKRKKNKANQGKKNKSSNPQNNTQNLPLVEPPVVTIRNDITVENTGLVGLVTDYSKFAGYCDEIVAVKEAGDLPPGIYYGVSDGLIQIPLSTKNHNRAPIQANQLKDLHFTDHVITKMYNYNDIRHSFSVVLEKNFGSWARVVIGNSITDLNQLVDPQKKFTLYITIPGRIYLKDYRTGNILQKVEGIFEFVVIKNLYTSKGLCTHRFFAPNGVIGADRFGAKYQ